MNYTYTDELYHHGIKGQKWGVRRFQNDDGSLTSAGRERYGVSIGGAARRTYAKVLNASAKVNRAFGNKSMAASKERIAKSLLKKADSADKSAYMKREARDRAFAKKHLGMSDTDYDSAMKKADGAKYKKHIDDVKNSPEYKAERNAKIKKAMIGAAVVGGVALAAYGGMKYSQSKAKYNDAIARGVAAMNNSKAYDATRRGYDSLWSQAAPGSRTREELHRKSNDLLNKTFEQRKIADDAFDSARNTAYYKLHTKKQKDRLESKKNNSIYDYSRTTTYKNDNEYSVKVSAIDPVRISRNKKRRP